jgi:glutathione S-transferase
MVAAVFDPCAPACAGLDEGAAGAELTRGRAGGVLRVLMGACTAGIFRLLGFDRGGGRSVMVAIGKAITVSRRSRKIGRDHAEHHHEAKACLDTRRAPGDHPRPMKRPRGRVLFQFPISHFCEKSRWNLDAKGLAYEVRDVTPGLHVRELGSLSPRRKVPVLVDGNFTVADSASIARYLEHTYPEVPVYPEGAADRDRALAIEAYFGDRPGRVVRQWMYGQLGARPGGIVRALYAAYPAPIRRVAALAAPLIEQAMRRRFHLDAAGIADARRGIDEALDRIEQETASDPDRYLVGSRLSIADIAAASLLGPLVAPPGSPWAARAARANVDGVPETIAATRAELSRRPGWAWVVRRYARDRALQGTQASR